MARCMPLQAQGLASRPRCSSLGQLWSYDEKRRVASQWVKSKASYASSAVLTRLSRAACSAGRCKRDGKFRVDGGAMRTIETQVGHLGERLGRTITGGHHG
jgi:hypothetical protein